MDPATTEVPQSALAKAASEELAKEYSAYCKQNAMSSTYGPPSPDVISVLRWPSWVGQHWENIKTYTHAIFFSGMIRVTTEAYLSYLRVVVIFYDLVGPERVQSGIVNH